MQLVNFALVTLAASQFVCSNNGQVTTFNMCVRNALTDPMTGQFGFTNPQLACQSILTVSGQREYYRCICERATSALDCYVFCPGDAIVATNRQLTNQFCEAWRLYPEDNAPVQSALPALPNVVVTQARPSVTATVQPAVQPTPAAIVTSAGTFDRLGMLFTAGSMVILMSVIFDF